MQQNNYPWLAPYFSQFVQQKRNNKIAHALLLTGNRGVAKGEFAKLLANTILCEHSRESACGECKHCHWFNVNNHPDFYHVEPLEGKRSISIQQIRELMSSLNLTAMHADYQIAIIQPAESMTTAAANALLKTLEEPNGQVMIIVVSHQPHQLPATIISRCHQLRIANPNDDQALAWLSNQLNDRDRAKTLLAINENLPLLAYENRDQPWEDFLNDWQQLSPISLAEKWQTLPPESVITILQQLMMDGLRYLLALPTRYFSQIPTSVWQNTSAKQITHYLQSLTTAKRLLQTSANPNPQLLLEKLFIDWNEVTHAR